MNGPQDTWGYCVLDNDYSKGEFPTNTPKENLQVTAAHEYFHAVQFGYDVSEDGWVMEATATWAEDELYDGVNDNVQYLRSGPMSLPHKSLDQFFQLYHYGAWIFFRYLTERFPASDGGMPILVRDLWRRLDDASGGRGEYSLEGVRGVLRKRDLSLTEAFAGFAAANRTPGRSYAEGKANRYPHAPLARAATLSQAVAPDRPAAAHHRPPGRRDGPLHPREEPGQREVAARADPRHGRTLEGHRRGGHDPAAQRRAEDQVGHPREERQRLAEVQVHDHEA